MCWRMLLVAYLWCRWPLSYLARRRRQVFLHNEKQDVQATPVPDELPYPTESQDTQDLRNLPHVW